MYNKWNSFYRRLLLQRRRCLQPGKHSGDAKPFVLSPTKLPGERYHPDHPVGRDKKRWEEQFQGNQRQMLWAVQRSSSRSWCLENSRLSIRKLILFWPRGCRCVIEDVRYLIAVSEDFFLKTLTFLTIENLNHDNQSGRMLERVILVVFYISLVYWKIYKICCQKFLYLVFKIHSFDSSISITAASDGSTGTTSYKKKDFDPFLLSSIWLIQNYLLFWRVRCRWLYFCFLLSSFLLLLCQLLFRGGFWLQIHCFIIAIGKINHK